MARLDGLRAAHVPLPECEWLAGEDRFDFPDGPLRRVFLLPQRGGQLSSSFSESRFGQQASNGDQNFLRLDIVLKTDTGTASDHTRCVIRLITEQWYAEQRHAISHRSGHRPETALRHHGRSLWQNRRMGDETLNPYIRRERKVRRIESRTERNKYPGLFECSHGSQYTSHQRRLTLIERAQRYDDKRASVRRRPWRYPRGNARILDRRSNMPEIGWHLPASMIEGRARQHQDASGEVKLFERRAKRKQTQPSPRFIERPQCIAMIHVADDSPAERIPRTTKWSTRR